MARYGNTSVSSLLSMARSALKKQQQYEEEIASYEFDLSEKSQEDYQKYAEFLNKRISQVKDLDPSRALSLQRKITGAQRSFTSSEIQRQSINVIEGTGSKQGKLNTLINLYRQALANGDEGLAQRLQYQADQLQVSIMNERSGGGYGSRSGGGSGSSSADATAAKKGIDAQLDQIDYGIKSLGADFRKGSISSKDYIAKAAQLYDAKNKILSSTYTVDAEGYIRPNQYSSLSNNDLYSFYQKHSSLQDSKEYKQIIGNNPNIPIEKQLARIGGYYQQEIDPITGEANLVPGNVVGLRRMVEFGSSLSAPTVDLNPDGNKYKKAFESIGIDGQVDKGKLKRTYTNILGDTKEGTFFLDNPDNPKYAFTEDAGGARYALDPDTGKTVILGTSAAADKSLGVLYSRLENPNISQQEREAIMNDIRNTNTDLVPEDLLNKANQSKVDYQFKDDPLGAFVKDRILPNKESVSLGNIPGNVNKLLDRAKQSQLAKEAEGYAKELGTTLSGFKSGIFGVLPELQKRVNQLKVAVQQKREKEAAEAAQRAEAQRIAIAAASRAALAKVSPTAVPNFRTNTLQGAVGPHRIPAATQKAADTIGTPEFTQKYAFPYLDLNKYLR